MEFFARKLISALLLPVPIILLLLAIAVLALWASQTKSLARKFSTAALVLLLLFSCAALPTWLLGNLEFRYPALVQMPANAKAIVVLGGGVRDNTNAPASTQLSSATLSRLVEAIRLYRQQPDSILILSGGRVFNSTSDAEGMDNLATALGVPRQNILIENGSRDTHQEALYLRNKLKDKPFVLVTSAFHMPRAMALFEAQGLHPIAAPTQFLIKYNSHSPKDYLPNTANLLYTDIALHEYFGIWWAKLHKEI